MRNLAYLVIILCAIEYSEALGEKRVTYSHSASEESQELTSLVKKKIKQKETKPNKSVIDRNKNSHEVGIEESDFDDKLKSKFRPKKDTSKFVNTKLKLNRKIVVQEDSDDNPDYADDEDIKPTKNKRYGNIKNGANEDDTDLPKLKSKYLKINNKLSRRVADNEPVDKKVTVKTKFARKSEPINNTKRKWQNKNARDEDSDSDDEEDEENDNRKFDDDDSSKDNEINIEHESGSIISDEENDSNSSDEEGSENMSKDDNEDDDGDDATDVAAKTEKTSKIVSKRLTKGLSKRLESPPNELVKNYQKENNNMKAKRITNTYRYKDKVGKSKHDDDSEESDENTRNSNIELYCDSSEEQCDYVVNN